MVVFNFISECIILTRNYTENEVAEKCSLSKYLPSEQVGPVYEVISQSHAYEFHCCTHTPRLAQML
jgi:hypothetical protein